jgi:high-affinity nickel-transport protein
MVSLGRLPLTCGLFFSLGHSTIVIVVNIALAISVDIYDKLDGVGSVGGIIGASVSSSFLFVVACINTYFLVTAIRERRRLKARSAAGLPLDTAPNAIHGGGCLVRITAPILRAVDTPWKLYPVGVLFGLGFDTASSIALLAISAIAVRGPHGEEIAHGRIVVLPFLFTAGMSLVDSLDSILMLYAYAQPELRTAGKWRLWTRKRAVVLGEEEGAERICSVDSNDRVARTDADDSDKDLHLPKDATDAKDTKLPQTDSPRAPDLPDLPGPRASSSKSVLAVDLEQEERSDKAQRMINAKTATMSDLSIALTLLSILVALA